VIYYTTSAGSGIWNKALVDASGGGVTPTVLTFLHLLVSLGSDLAIMRFSADEAPAAARLAVNHRRTAWDVVSAFTPISVFVILSKLATYMSYQHVSMALSHTAKATEPVFNVLVAALAFGELHNTAVYTSLVPIALGVTLASVTDLTYNHTGFFWATASALTKVLQNIYTRRLMDTQKFTFWEIHLYCGAASLIILVPVLAAQTMTAASSPFSHFPLGQLLVCSALQYASSVASYRVLHLTTHLTATIINVMKRLVLILSGVAFATVPLSFSNICGVLVAVAGILSYNLAKDAAPPPAPVAPAEVWRGLGRWCVRTGRHAALVTLPHAAAFVRSRATGSRMPDTWLSPAALSKRTDAIGVQLARWAADVGQRQGVSLNAQFAAAAAAEEAAAAEAALAVDSSAVDQHRVSVAGVGPAPHAGGLPALNVAPGRTPTPGGALPGGLGRSDAAAPAVRDVATPSALSAGGGTTVGGAVGAANAAPTPRFGPNAGSTPQPAGHSREEWAAAPSRNARGAPASWHGSAVADETEGDGARRQSAAAPGASPPGDSDASTALRDGSLAGIGEAAAHHDRVVSLLLPPAALGSGAGGPQPSSGDGNGAEAGVGVGGWHHQQQQQQLQHRAPSGRAGAAGASSPAALALTPSPGRTRTSTAAGKWAHSQALRHTSELATEVVGGSATSIYGAAIPQVAGATMDDVQRTRAAW
jgi:solute carrier family 35 protein E1